MDVATLEQLLREAEIRLYREELGIVRQRELIATLRRHGRDAADARACLRRLESSQARHIADRNRLFQALTIAGRAPMASGASPDGFPAKPGLRV
jgi:hypothetical protein